MFNIHLCRVLARDAWKGNLEATHILCDYCEEHGLSPKAVKEMRHHGRRDCRKLMKSSRKLFVTFITSMRSRRALIRWMNDLHMPVSERRELRRMLTWQEGLELGGLSHQSRATDKHVP